MPSQEENDQTVEFQTLDGKPTQPLKTPVWLKRGIPACTCILVIILFLFPAGGYNFLVKIIPSPSQTAKVTLIQNVKTPATCTGNNGEYICSKTKVKVIITKFTATIQTSNLECSATGTTTDLETTTKESLSVFKCAHLAIGVLFSMRFSNVLDTYYWPWGQKITIGIGNQNSVNVDTKGKPLLENYTA